MSDDDDLPGRPARGYLHEGVQGDAGYRPADGAPSRWCTLQSSLPLAIVQERICQALRSRPPLAPGPLLGGSEQKGGFLLRFKRGSRVLFAEVQLGAWESGTQVQVVVPAEQKEADVRVLADWLQRLLDAR